MCIRDRVQREENEKPANKSTSQDAKHERKGSALPPAPQGKSVPKSPMQNTPVSGGGPNGTQEKNPWQQAPSRKSHKKSKSTANGHGRDGKQGEVMPVNESERKGG